MATKFNPDLVYVNKIGGQLRPHSKKDLYLFIVGAAIRATGWTEREILNEFDPILFADGVTPREAADRLTKAIQKEIRDARLG